MINPVKMIPVLVLCLLGLPLTHGISIVSTNKCYAHYDLSDKYQLRHDSNYYPANEINLILEKHPEMKSMFYADDLPLPQPVSHYNPAPKPACPYNRFTLYSFFYAGKDCYVIYPDVQKVMYVQCGNDNNRDCQACSSSSSNSGWGYGNGGGGGVSKCEEDYDYRHVWAYCTHRHAPVPAARVPPQPRQPFPVPQINIPRPSQKLPEYPIFPDNRGFGSVSKAHLPDDLITPPKLPEYPTYPDNKGWGSDSNSKTHVSGVHIKLQPPKLPEYPTYPDNKGWGSDSNSKTHVSGVHIKLQQPPKPPVYPTYPDNKGWDSGSNSKTYVSAVYTPTKVVRPLDGPYRDPFGTMFRPYIMQHRWKRSYHSIPEPQGKIERMKLFLPHHCGCKAFAC